MDNSEFDKERDYITEEFFKFVRGVRVPDEGDSYTAYIVMSICGSLIYNTAGALEFLRVVNEIVALNEKYKK